MPRPLNTCPARPRVSAAAGFTVIEVIVAALILALVLGGAAVTIGSGAKAQQKVANQTEQVKVGQKALERLAGDQAARATCNAAWKTQTPPYTPCTVPYSMTGSTGRRYVVTATVRPIDDQSDGTYNALAATTVGSTAAGDADMNTRDHYDATVKVQLQAGYDVGLTDNSSSAPVPASNLAGRVDWHELASNGSVHVDVCAFDRPDRSVQNVSCAAGAANAAPVAGVPVTLTPTSEPGNTATGPVSGVTNGAGAIDLVRTVPPGSYSVNVPASSGGMRFFRSQPSELTVRGGALQTIAVTMSRPGGTTIVCGYISNPDDTWGYEINSTHVMWGIYASPVYRGQSFDTYTDDSNYKCANPVPAVRDSVGNVIIPAKASPNVLGDPLRYDNTKMYRGKYSMEFQNVADPAFALPNQRAFNVQRVAISSSPCTRAAPGGATLPDGSSVLSSATVTPASGETPVWKGYYTRKSDATQYICVQMYDKPVPKIICTAPYTGCRYDGTFCSMYCPSGMNVCTANCGGVPSPPPGTTGPPATTDNTGVTGGPNDGTVPCSGTNPASPWGTDWWQYRGNSDQSGFKWHNWIGANSGGPFAYPYSGGHAWGAAGKFTCDEFEFAAKNANSSSGLYQFGDCIEVEGFGGHKVRGLVEDTTGGAGRLWVSINAARALRPEVSDGPTNLVDNWNAFGFARTDHGGNPGLGYDATGWPNLIVRKVRGDATCHWTNDNTPVIEWRDPVISVLYTKPDVARNIPDPPTDAINKGNTQQSTQAATSTAPPTPGLRSL